MDDGMNEKRTDGRVARVDRWRIHVDEADIKTDERGFAQFWGTVITADSVLEYGPADGHDDGHLEFIPESTVFDEDSISTLRNAPVTFLHPATPVNARNSSRLSVGHIVDVKRDGSRLRALHQIEDAEALGNIRDGIIELSPGYTTRLEEAEGLVIDGRTVHAIQRERVYNHQAIVPEARAGHDNALTIDAAVLPADGLRIQQKGPVMAEYKFDGRTVEVDADLLAHIATLAGGSKDAENDPDEEEEDSKSKDAGDDEDEEDSKSEDADDDDAKDAKAKDGDPPDPTSDGKVDAKAIAAEVSKIVMETIATERKQYDAARSRSDSILADARRVLPESYQFDGKPDDQIMRAAIREVDADMAPRAKAMKGDALFGFFSGVVHAPRSRIDTQPIAQRTTSYQDAIAFSAARTELVASCGATGDTAIGHENVVKLQFGKG